MNSTSLSRMGSLDALFLYAEDGTAHMHIGSCATFGGVCPTMAEFSRLVESKLHLVDRFRQRVRFVPGNVGRPVWVDDPYFALGEHLHWLTLRPPADDAALEALMGELMSTELRRDRALWEMWLVDGLSHGRWALVSKVHHCMVDGVAGTDLLAALLNDESTATIPEPKPWRPTPPPTDLRLLLDALVESSLQPVRAVGSMISEAGSLAEVVQAVRNAALGLWSFGRWLAPGPSTAGGRKAARSITGRIGPQRRWAVARSDLDQIRDIRSVFGGSINDVVVAVVTGAFRSVLAAHGEAASDVRVSALVPVSLRVGHDHVLDNKVSMIIAELPVEIDDPLERLSAVSGQMQALKASHQADAGTSVFGAIDFIPANVFAMAAQASTAVMRRAPQRTINTVITNVPGPQQPLYALEHEMLEYLPYVPIGEGVRLGVAVLSYNGRCTFGITGDGEAAADVALLAASVESELAALHSLAQPAPRPTPRPTPRTAARPARRPAARQRAPRT